MTRRPIVGPLLLALLFLAVIGGSAGVILGRTQANGAGAARGTSTPSGGTEYPPPTQTQRPDASHSQEPCLDHTEQLARQKGSAGGLSVVLYIQTTASEVWICRDSAGRLWYQGHTGTAADRDLVEDRNALFLSQVGEESGGYVATNPGTNTRTEYHVSRQKLVVDYIPGDGFEERVVDSRP
jgi:hypothetical protein